MNTNPQLKTKQRQADISSDLVAESRLKKGYLDLAIAIIFFSATLIFTLFRGPSWTKAAIFISCILGFGFGIAAGIRTYGQVPTKFNKAILYITCLFLPIVIILAALPPLNTRVVVVNNYGWETRYVTKTYPHIQPDGQTIDIPVKRGKVYLENNTTVALEEYEVFYNDSELENDYIEPIRIAPGEFKQIHDQPRYMFRNPPKREKKRSKSVEASNRGITGYFSVVRVIKD